MKMNVVLDLSVTRILAAQTLWEVSTAHAMMVFLGMVLIVKVTFNFQAVTLQRLNTLYHFTVSIEIIVYINR